jgi:hypothetical protein
LEAFEADSALDSGYNLSDIVLEATETANAPLINYGTIT